MKFLIFSNIFQHSDNDNFKFVFPYIEKQIHLEKFNTMGLFWSLKFLVLNTHANQ